MEYINLIDVFDREIEVLEINKSAMIYAIDQKNEVMDLCGLERYDFATGEKTRLVTLDYTRIYESFQTYGQMANYFYAINVLQDYRLRLRRINKKSWESEGELIIEALGEILSIHILNEQYMLIVDEVKKTEEFLHDYKMEDDGGDYMNLCYLYDCYTKKRYPVTDKRLHGYLDVLKVMDVADGPWVVVGIHHGEDIFEEHRLGKESAIYEVKLDALIEAVTSHAPLFLDDICLGDAQHAVRFLENDNDEIVYREIDFERQEESVIRYVPNSDCQEILHTYVYKNTGTYFYDKADYNVYYEKEDMSNEMMPDGAREVICLTDGSRNCIWDGSYGEFSGICKKEIFLTTFYKEVMVKEYEYHEYVAVHHTGNPEPEVFEGRFETFGDKVILLRTFLAL